MAGLACLPYNRSAGGDEALATRRVWSGSTILGRGRGERGEDGCGGWMDWGAVTVSPRRGFAYDLRGILFLSLLSIEIIFSFSRVHSSTTFLA